MKRTAAFLAVAALALGLAACGSSHTAASSQASALAKSAQTKKAEAYTRTVVEGCLNKGGGLRAMIHCAVPPHHGAAFLRCALKGAPTHLKGNTQAIEGDLVKCGERYR